MLPPAPMSVWNYPSRGEPTRHLLLKVNGLPGGSRVTRTVAEKHCWTDCSASAAVQLEVRTARASCWLGSLTHLRVGVSSP
jgi:hypothetical protein